MDKKLIVQRIDELLKEKNKTKYAMKEDTGISSTIYQWRKFNAGCNENSVIAFHRKGL